MRRTAASLLVAALVMLAGCAGGIAGPNASGGQTADGDSGTVQFYVSDEQNAISQFEHLNVTVTSVGFAQTSAANASGDADANVTATSTSTTTGSKTTTSETNETTTESEDERADDPENETESESESESESEDEAESGDEGQGDIQWVERDVENRTVDLTELQGANATLLGNMTVPAGEYEKVFVHVGEVEGTLKTGEQVNVKLPSQKLHLNEDFTVNRSSDVEFVFDITVFEAGNSGKYILKPVASESGTDVLIERVVVESDDEAEAELEANFVGNVTAGENATVRVTQNGDPVENATVEVGEVTVTTDANGTASVSVPEDAEELELEASTAEGSAYGEAEAELEVSVGGESGDDSDAENETESENEADGEVELGATLEGSLAPGENATVVVTDGDGEPVEDAEVAVDGEVVGETNADGELTFAVPGDVSLDTEVTVTADGETITLDSTTAASAS